MHCSLAGNSRCTGAGAPLACCTGAGAGSCAIESNACTGAGAPFACCTGSQAGTCPANDQSTRFDRPGTAWYWCDGTAEAWVEVPAGGGGSGDITAVGDGASGAVFTAAGVGNSLFFEGPTADANEVELTAADGAGIITLPAETGTACTTGSVCAGYAPLASPALTGDPLVPTAAGADNDTSAASTAFVAGEITTHTGNASAHHAATVDTDTTCLDAGVNCLFAASGTEGGAALSGDSATAFFAAGQLEAARGGTALDTSASTGVFRVTAGTWSADAGLSHLAASTSADLAGVVSDETGSGALVLATGPTIAGATMSGVLDLNDGVGDTPFLTWTPTTGTAFSAFVADADDDLRIEVSTATAERVELENTGAGDIDLDVRGTITAVSFAADASANPASTWDDSDDAGTIDGRLLVGCPTATDCDMTLEGEVAAVPTAFLEFDADNTDLGGPPEVRLGGAHAGPVEVGSAIATAISLLTDGAGDAEVVLPADSVSDAEVSDTLTVGSGGSVDPGAVGANHIDAITELAAAVRSGADATLVTGTAGATGNCAQWNLDGDLVDSGAGCGGGSSEWTDLGTVLHPTETGDDVALGGTALVNASKLSIDGDADQVQLSIQQNATQTDAPVIIEDSVGNEIATVEPGGLITTAVGIDAIGAVDLDYGSADVTDHTFLTDGTGTAEVVLPVGSIDSAEILDASIAIGDLAAGTDGELITWDASGNAATVGAGTSGQVLTSNGAGAAPTFQAAGGAAPSVIQWFNGDADDGNAGPAGFANDTCYCWGFELPGIADLDRFGISVSVADATNNLEVALFNEAGSTQLFTTSLGVGSVGPTVGTVTGAPAVTAGLHWFCLNAPNASTLQMVAAEGNAGNSARTIFYHTQTTGCTAGAMPSTLTFAGSSGTEAADINTSAAAVTTVPFFSLQDVSDG